MKPEANTDGTSPVVNARKDRKARVETIPSILIDLIIIIYTYAV